MVLEFTKETMVSDYEDLNGLYEITDPKDITNLLGDTIILNRFKNDFMYLYRKTNEIAVLCWNNFDKRGNKLQHTPIKFKVDVDDKKEYTLPLNRFLQSLTFINAVIDYIDEVDLDCFVVQAPLTKNDRKTLQQNIVRTLQERGHGISEIQTRIAKNSYDLKHLMIDFTHADCTVFTAENLFLNHYRDSPLIREINNTEYPSDMQTTEIIKENAARYELLAGEMLRLGNPLFVMNQATPIVKPKQMEELYINFSQIPDGRNIISVIMNGNGFKAGYSTIPVLYAGAIAARVPDIMNEKYMGIAGYFNRNLMILTYGTLSKTVWDCGTVNPIPIIVDDVVLEMCDGRFYYPEGRYGILRTLSKKDKHLIGKKILLRSPCTCNLNEDICHVCWGSKALKVGLLPGGSIYTTELLTSRVSQNILSAKHLLKTDAEPIELTPNYDKWFEFDSSTLIPRSDGKRFDIYIREDYQDNISEALTLYIGPEKQLTPIVITNYSNIYIPDKIIDQCKDVVIDDVTYLKITSHKVLESEECLCDITPINIMMTQKYMNMMRLFESDISKFDNISDAVTTLMHLMHGNIPILSTHGELIISKHIRSKTNNMVRPNWLNPGEEYQMLRLKTALQNTESVTTALAFEQPKHHLLNAIFDERNKIKRVGPRSATDFLFMHDMSA
jgi:hypothetical protein